MESTKVFCNAKINLYLKVKGRRQDGFHEIETVYHSISLHDRITITQSDSEFSISSDNVMVPSDDTNLALRAARAVLSGTSQGVHIDIDKTIPVGSGLGGGSADAAGVLVGVNKLLGLQYSIEALEDAAEDLGSDVKFMIRGGCAIGRGRGEVLEFLPTLPDLPVVLVVPDITISTAWAYDVLRLGLTTAPTQLSMITSALRNGDVGSLCNLLENDFEDLVFDRFPDVGRIKEELVGCGARGALMSGSGPAVYGIFLKASDAQQCCAKFLDRGLTAIILSLAGHGVTIPV